MLSRLLGVAHRHVDVAQERGQRRRQAPERRHHRTRPAALPRQIDTQVDTERMSVVCQLKMDSATWVERLTSPSHTP